MMKYIVILSIFICNFSFAYRPIGGGYEILGYELRDNPYHDKGSGYKSCYQVTDAKLKNNNKYYEKPWYMFECRRNRDIDTGKVVSTTPTYLMKDKEGKCWELDSPTSGLLFKDRRYGAFCSVKFVSAPLSTFMVEKRKSFFNNTFLADMFSDYEQCVQLDSATLGTKYKKNVDMKYCTKFVNENDYCYEVDFETNGRVFKREADYTKCELAPGDNVNNTSRHSVKEQDSGAGVQSSDVSGSEAIEN